MCDKSLHLEGSVLNQLYICHFQGNVTQGVRNWWHRNFGFHGLICAPSKWNARRKRYENLPNLSATSPNHQILDITGVFSDACFYCLCTNTDTFGGGLWHAPRAAVTGLPATRVSRPGTTVHASCVRERGLVRRKTLTYTASGSYRSSCYSRVEAGFRGPCQTCL